MLTLIPPDLRPHAREIPKLGWASARAFAPASWPRPLAAYTAAVMAAFVHIPLLLARIPHLASCDRHAVVVIRPEPSPPLRRHAILMAGWWALIFSVYFAALPLVALVSPVISWALFVALPVTLLSVAVSEVSRERSNRRQPLKQLIAHLHQGGHLVWTVENYAAWPTGAGHGEVPEAMGFSASGKLAS